MSGKNRLISIINPAVKVNHIAKATGTVDKYFIRFLSIVNSHNNNIINEVKY